MGNSQWRPEAYSWFYQVTIIIGLPYTPVQEEQDKSIKKMMDNIGNLTFTVLSSSNVEHLLEQLGEELKAALVLALQVGMVGYLFFGILLAGILLMQSFGVFPKSSANLDQMPPVKAEYAWKDIVSGDTMCSDSYPHSLIFDGAVLEVRGRPTSMDIVDAFQLREVQMTKQEFMAWAENFLAKITDKLTESGKEDRIAGFKKGAADLVKFIVGKYDQFKIFAGPSSNLDASFAFAYQKEPEDKGLTFLYFRDAMKMSWNTHGASSFAEKLVSVWPRGF
ncbi:unnamed protein product [Symbiodinium natans]|uniref:TCTP domain-containing protein n=1 Tax=Symbiodinium natans TaxID=878477 RepID=A0A812VBP5_9DINO|nr:unnamed protein product [Symbiodinium natans]